MLFNSYVFVLLFLPLCIIGYFGLNKMFRPETAQAFLVVMSLWFYGYFNAYYLFVILGSVLFNYGIYKLLVKKKQKAVMVVGILGNLGVLFYFKYMDFFLSNVNVLFKSDFDLLGIVLPLGISFFTFQQISFVVDAYRGEIPAYSFLYYVSFVTYFPQLVAGPIVTHDELIPQFMDEAKKKVDFDNLSKGLYVFSLGMAKKVLLADVFGNAVNWGYLHIDELNSTAACLIMLGYTIQIYFDFSGYCDMAIGIGKMMNIDLPINFNSPYKAATITEFWDRWHMTLTRFFTKYVYIPLGGNRRGTARTYLNVFIVFLASGLWHGASWGFVLWGVLHGIFSIITRAAKKTINKIPRAINWFVTFLFVNVAWIFFRAETISKAWKLIGRIFAFDFGKVPQGILDAFNVVEWDRLMKIVPLNEAWPALAVFLFFAFAMILILFFKNAVEQMSEMKKTGRQFITASVLLAWCVFSFSGISTFLYFNF